MPVTDRRSEDRHPAEGPMKFSFDDPSPREVTGRLVDYSKSGFRAVHNCTNLHAGQVVEFQHVVAFGKARVMWNRISNENVETGFLVIK